LVLSGKVYFHKYTKEVTNEEYIVDSMGDWRSAQGILPPWCLSLHDLMFVLKDENNYFSSSSKRSRN
jgi:hypothetical protein